MKPLLALTMGDTNGIGPEILAKALASKALYEFCRPVVLGSVDILEKVSAQLGITLTCLAVNSPEQAAEASDAIPVIESDQLSPPYSPGTLDPRAGVCAIAWLKQSVAYALDGRIAGIVTCPINKECIHKAGFDFIGHTDLIAELTNSPDYRMCLLSDTMRVVHLSSHCSLREAIEQCTCERIVDSTRIADTALRALGLPRRRIAVAGLNPHAGEAGAFGTEERDEIAPAVAQCQAEGIDCSGPYPPDTVFRRMREGEFDLVISMYHDQGHIALKLVAMDEGVNVTLGIPIVRTSVDHGTAYDIAGKGIAREDSLIAATKLAAQLSVIRDTKSALSR